MSNTIEYKGYIGNIEFSEIDKVFYGKVQGIRSLISYEGENANDPFYRQTMHETILYRIFSSHGGIVREALINSARADGRRFCFIRKFEKWRNTVCISRFSNCTDGTKDSPISRRRIIQRFLRIS